MNYYFIDFDYETYYTHRAQKEREAGRKVTCDNCECDLTLAADSATPFDANNLTECVLCSRILCCDSHCVDEGDYNRVISTVGYTVCGPCTAKVPGSHLNGFKDIEWYHLELDKRIMAILEMRKGKAPEVPPTNPNEASSAPAVVSQPTLRFCGLTAPELNNLYTELQSGYEFYSDFDPSNTECGACGLPIRDPPPNSDNEDEEEDEEERKGGDDSACEAIQCKACNVVFHDHYQCYSDEYWMCWQRGSTAYQICPTCDEMSYDLIDNDIEPDDEGLEIEKYADQAGEMIEAGHYGMFASKMLLHLCIRATEKREASKKRPAEETNLEGVPAPKRQKTGEEADSKAVAAAAATEIAIGAN